MTVTEVVPFIVLAFLLLSAALIATRLLTGSINSRYLLDGRRKDGTLFFSPGRAQLLVITFGVAFGFIAAVLQNPRIRSLPDLPSPALALLGASHLVYLGGKASSRFSHRRRK